MGSDIGITLDVYKNSIYQPEPDLVNSAQHGVTIPVYDVSGNKTEISPSDLGSHGDYYIKDVSSLEDSQKEAQKVKYYYVKYPNKDSGTWYMRKDEYAIDSNGMVNRGYTYNKEDDWKNYNKNKYLTNTSWKVYTQFRYLGDDGSILNFSYSKNNSKWYIITGYDSNNNPIKEWYYLVPSADNRSRPNHLPTYLNESCKVTLGGGYNLQYTGNGSSIKSGKITISDYVD